jgi:S-DNA-T family DNA segregation ATPase FtsK/SpoIIIE
VKDKKELYIIGLEGIGLCVCVFLIFSCLGFNIADAPSDYAFPHNDPTSNWCGPIGAFFAYYLLYYLGPGVYVLLAAIGWSFGVSLGKIKISQPALRGVGLLILVTAVSASVSLIAPNGSGRGFPTGSGGIIGISTVHFLFGHVGRLGTAIIVLSGYLIGAVVLADSVVLAGIRFCGVGICKLFALAVPAMSAARKHSQAVSDIWSRLSEKQKQLAKPIEKASKDKLKKERIDLRRARRQPINEETVMAITVVEPEKMSKQKKNIIKGQAPKTDEEPEPIQEPGFEDYQFPPLDLLHAPEYGFTAIQDKMVSRKGAALERLLGEFGVNAHVVNAEPGPAITMYELELAAGVKVSQISNLANDMARALGAGSVRVVAPLPGRHTIGVEAPNSQRETVRLKELIQHGGSRPERMQIPLYLGKSSSGEVLVSDLGKMPHLLIAGTTGSGKSVCINSIITSILMMRRPDEVKFILIDPKMVEMTMFESIPHLMCPIVTETKRAEQILEWATTKMDERYELLAEARVRNLASYNKLGAEEIIRRFNPSTPQEEAQIPKKMAHMVIVIDELADLMMTAAKEIETYIVRLAQKSRAVGIHLVVATQRPQATVVTGLIKSNMPARIGFRVAARMDSRIILDQNGGETLLGEGDMLFLKPGTSDLMRSQGAFVDDKEINKITKFLEDVAQPQFHPELMQLNRIDASAIGKDDLFDEAVRIVLETKRGSVSLLQRRLGIGYARASRIIEMMAAAGVLGAHRGSQAREVVMTLDEYDRLQKQMVADEVAGYTDLTDAEDEESEDFVEDVITVGNEIE